MTKRQSTFSTETLALIVAVLGTGIVYLDQTALNVALPAIQQGLNADIGALQWIVDIYLWTLATLLLIGGVLGDRFGRVRIYVIGMFLFILTSIVCGLAQTVTQMIVARGLQGVGGALLVPGGLALINAVSAPERRGRLIGTWGSFTSMIVAFGPTLGGWLVDYVSWRMVFFINVPLGLLACILALYYVPESTNKAQHDHLDWPGFITLLLGLGGLLFGLIEGTDLGWQHPLILATTLGGLLSLLLFIVVEYRSPNPMLPLALFKDRTFAGINLVTLIHWVSINALFFFFPLSLQQVQGFTAAQAGLSLLPISILIIILSNLAGWATDRVGAQPLIFVGIAITGIAFWLFGRIGLIDSYWQDIFPITLLYGFGLGLTIVPLTTVAMSSLPIQHSGIASGVNNAASRIAGMFAVAFFGAVMVTQFHKNLLRYLTGLNLDEDRYAQLLAESRNLGATSVPDGLSTELTDAVQKAIHLAFVDSFGWIMVLCVGVTVMSLVVLVGMVTWLPKNKSY